MSDQPVSGLRPTDQIRFDIEVMQRWASDRYSAGTGHAMAVEAQARLAADADLLLAEIDWLRGENEILRLYRDELYSANAKLRGGSGE